MATPSSQWLLRSCVCSGLAKVPPQPGPMAPGSVENMADLGPRNPPHVKTQYVVWDPLLCYRWYHPTCVTARFRTGPYLYLQEWFRPE